MKILFDHQAFTMQKYGGITRYFANLHKYLNQQADTTCTLSLFYSRNHYVSNESFPFSEKLNQVLFKKENRLNKWNKWYSQHNIGKNDFDVFHPTYYNPYFLSKLKKPFVLTVHDMIHELLPEYFLPYGEHVHFKRLLIEKADHIIAISESTKNDIQQVYGLPNDKISVIYHGYEGHFSSPADAESFKLPFTNYILFVGERIGYKNFYKLIIAFSQLLKTSKDIQLVCVGGGRFETSELELLHRYGISASVHQISATDVELCKLYHSALLLVYPSLYEGFGLPLLEAFYNGCPVAVSNTSCFKEVGGEAVVYFNPYDPEEIKHTMETIIFDPIFANQLRMKGAEQLKAFTMETCMRETLEVYKKVV